MNEAPKKVWIHEGFWRSGGAGYWTGDEKTSSEDIHYIRADIFDEVVKAFGEVLRISDRDHEAWNKARAALKKLEEE